MVGRNRRLAVLRQIKMRYSRSISVGRLIVFCGNCKKLLYCPVMENDRRKIRNLAKMCYFRLCQKRLYIARAVHRLMERGRSRKSEVERRLRGICYHGKNSFFAKNRRAVAAVAQCADNTLSKRFAGIFTRRKLCH